jgi:predicted secreted hydrolase
VSLVTSLAARRLRRICVPILTIIVLAAGSGAVHSAPVVQIGQPPLVHFPADQAAHAGAANEWWYVVGHLRSGDRSFGYELTIFKFDHVKIPGTTLAVSLFRTDVAITDEAAQRFHQHVTYYFPGAASASTTTLNVRAGSASLSGATPRNMALQASLPAGVIRLRLSSRRAPMYVGGRGYLHFGDGYTYYYSLTDLATTGTIHIGHVTYSVTGTSWLDHQWGAWSWSTIRGWTWMALQLSVFDVRGTAVRVKAASVLLANGILLTLPGMTITPTGSWTSPHTHAVYPSGWIIKIPTLGATLRVTPAVQDQEVFTRGQGFGTYWEGSGRVSGTWQGKAVSGLSYTELTGYAGGFASGTQGSTVQLSTNWSV